jgi:hypothetical protein
MSSSEQLLSRPPRTYGDSPHTQTAQKARCWLITVNMKGDIKSHENVMRLRRFNAGAQVPPCTYAIFQPEVGESGTYHIQAYVEMAKPMTLTSVKKHFGESIHAEIRLGSQQQAIDYCSKEDTRAEDGEVVEYGEKMRVNKSGGTQGGRADWADAWSKLKGGKRPAEVLDDHPHMLPCVRALHHARTEALSGQHREGKTKLIVLYGDSNTGKSTTARVIAERKGEWVKVSTSGNNLWFDHYDPMRHRTVILDEFTGSKCKLTQLNELADESQFFVETKGSTLPWLAKQLVITSNFHPSKWYDFENPEKHLDLTSLMRRIDVLVELRKEDVAIQGTVRPMCVVTVHKGIFNARQVSSALPLHSTQFESDETPLQSNSEEESSISTPGPSTSRFKKQRVRRQDANIIGNLSSTLPEIPESDDE